MKPTIKVASTLILKGALGDMFNMRIFRVYNDHYVVYDEHPTEGGISRGAKVFNKEDMTNLLTDMVTEGDLLQSDMDNFLRH